MRFALCVVVLAGCANEADVVLELHRTTTDSVVSYAVCDAAHPDDCAELEGTSFGGDTVFRIGIYVEESLAPPLSVHLQQGLPSACRFLDIPDAERGLVVVRFGAADSDPLTIEDCPSCGQRPCP